MRKAIRNRESKSCESKSVYISFTEAIKKRPGYESFSGKIIDKVEKMDSLRGKSAQVSKRSKPIGVSTEVTRREPTD